MEDSKIRLFQGDITRFEADAIVNAANTSLLGGGGVDGAIHRAGGPAILQACQAIRARQGGCAVGEAVITTAGNLPAKYVIHTVGPVWNEGKSQEVERLESAYRNCMLIAAQHGVRTIAFPNISTGIYRFPKEMAAEIAIATVKEQLATNLGIAQVTFVCFDADNFAVYSRLLQS